MPSKKPNKPKKERSGWVVEEDALNILRGSMVHPVLYLQRTKPRVIRNGGDEKLVRITISLPSTLNKNRS